MAEGERFDFLIDFHDGEDVLGVGVRYGYRVLGGLNGR